MSKAIKRTFAVIFVIVALFAGWGLVYRPMSRPARVHVNRGSCLQAVSTGLEAVLRYARTNGSLPYNSGGSVALLEGLDINAELAMHLEYINRSNVSVVNEPELVILICNHETLLDDGRPGKYVGLLSGMIWIMPSEQAVLGAVCPTNKGFFIQ